jgi:hypothetical protein
LLHGEHLAVERFAALLGAIIGKPIQQRGLEAIVPVGFGHGLSKSFFSEEKKQKTFTSWWWVDTRNPHRPSAMRAPSQAKRNKSFLVLFFKKEHS